MLQVSFMAMQMKLIVVVVVAFFRSSNVTVYGHLRVQRLLNF